SSYQSQRRFSSAALLLLVPVMAIVMYATLSKWDWKAVQLQSTQAGDIEEAVKSLEAKLAENPDHIEGWFMLGRSYMHMLGFPLADDEYQRANILVKVENVDVVVTLGKALMLTDEDSRTCRAGQLSDTSLGVAQNQPSALWYGGVPSLRSGD